MRRYLLVIVLLVAGCSSTDKPVLTTQVATTATTATTTAAASAAVVLKADGQQDTAPFHLDSGRYKSTWQAFDDCEYFGDLKPGNFPYVLRAARVASGQTFINGVKSGEYYIHMNTGPSPECRWQITLERV